MTRATRLGMAAGAAALGTLALAAPAMAAGPHAVAKPNTKLKNAQVVKVVFSGFPANGTVYGLECSKHVKTAADEGYCDINHVKIAKANAKGAGSFKFTVRTGKIGKGQCKPVSTNCVIAVAAQTTPPTVANASIHFGK